MKHDTEVASEIDRIARWAAKQRGRIGLLAERMNKHLRTPVSPRSVPNWLNKDHAKRSEPSWSSGLALKRAFNDLTTEIPNKVKCGAGSAGADEPAASAPRRDS